MEEIYVRRIKRRSKSYFEKHAKNADALSPNGSTCDNESFNLVIVSKTHKMHYHPSYKASTFALIHLFFPKNIGQTWKM